jgi:hypothetical protein
VSYLIRISFSRRTRPQPPAPAPMRQACDLFERFHCFPPWRVAKFRCRRALPRVMVHVGELRGLIYRSDRGQRRCPRSFVHFLETPAQLTCDPTGRQLYILGGRYRVTPRGIEG